MGKGKLIKICKKKLLDQEFIFTNNIFLFSITLLLGILAISFSFVSPDYLFADDLLFRQILDGTMSANGLSYEFIVSINVIYANFIKKLYLYSNKIDWYDLSYLAITIITIFIIILSSINIVKDRFSRKILTILYLFLLPILFIKVQFSLVSGALNLSVALLVLNYLSKDNVKKYILLLGAIYIFIAALLSFLIRPYNFYFYGLCFTLITLFFLPRILKFNKVIKLIPLFTLIVISHIYVTQYNNDYYANYPETRDILSHNALNFYIMDRTEFPEQNEIIKIKNELMTNEKWKIEDFMLMRYGFFYNKSYFCYECKQDLLGISAKYLTHKKINDLNYIEDNFKATFVEDRFIHSTAQMFHFNILTMILVGAILLGTRGISEGVKVSLLMFMIFFALGFIFKQIPFRLAFPITIFSYLILILNLRNKKFSKNHTNNLQNSFNNFLFRIYSKISSLNKNSMISKNRVRFILIIILIALLAMQLNKHMEINYEKEKTSKIIKSKITKVIESDKIYFHHAFPYPYDTFEMPYKKLLDMKNLKFLSWLYLSPAFGDFLKENNIENFELDICKNGNIRLLFDENYGKSFLPYLKSFLYKNYKINTNFVVENNFSYHNFVTKTDNIVNIYKCEI